MKQSNKDDYEQFRRFPLYVMLCCGVIVIAIGVYLSVYNRTVVGTTIPNKYGSGGGHPISMRVGFDPFPG